MFKTEVVIHSIAKEHPDKPYDVATIIHENGSNDVVAEYKGIRYTAIFNVFVCRYYVDDLYGRLPDQNTCPTCGESLPDSIVRRSGRYPWGSEDSPKKEY